MTLVNQQGVSFLAKEIKDRLGQIDPRLGLAIMPNAMHDGKTLWAVTYWWGEADPRRAAVREGQRDPDTAFDILGYLPADCDVTSAFDYIVRRFRILQNRSDVKQMLDNVHRFNAARKAEILKPTQELADELASTNARHMFKDLGKSIGSTLDVGPKSKRDEQDFRDFVLDGG